MYPDCDFIKLSKTVNGVYVTEDIADKIDRVINRHESAIYFISKEPINLNRNKYSQGIKTNTQSRDTFCDK